VDQADIEQAWAMAGFIVCLMSFSAYLFYQARQCSLRWSPGCFGELCFHRVAPCAQVKFANIEDAVDRATREAIGQKLISVSGAFALDMRVSPCALHPIAARFLVPNGGMVAQLAGVVDESTPLAASENKRFRSFLKDYFNKYDINGDGQIDSEELLLLFR
jgi:hypothetical protein